tara:strand:- start:380 stop:976 length:597 start_codon:yes stop_codon:yes gene_type:complete
MSTKKETASQTTRASNTTVDSEIQKILVDGEHVILRAKFHGAIYWKSVAVLIFSVLIGLFVHQFGILFMIVGAIMLCIAILTQHYLLLVITNKRVLARYGLLQMDVIDIRLSKIESIDLERMMPGHVFGYANVVVMGTGQRLIRIPFVKNANDFRKFYNEMVLAEEGNEEAEEIIEKEKATKKTAAKKKTPTKKKKKT